MKKHSTLTALLMTTLMGIAVPCSQAMEDKIPINVYNESWAFKTRLDGTVIYNEHKPQATFDIALEGRGDENTVEKTITQFTVPKGKIKAIHFYLRNYHENASSQDLEETLLGNLKFTPKMSVLTELTLTLRDREIVPEAKYSQPPLFFEKKI